MRLYNKKALLFRHSTFMGVVFILSVVGVELLVDWASSSTYSDTTILQKGTILKTKVKQPNGGHLRLDVVTSLALKRWVYYLLQLIEMYRECYHLCAVLLSLYNFIDAVFCVESQELTTRSLYYFYSPKTKISHCHYV